MNSTFMFGEDRLGPDQDFAATYRRHGALLIGSQGRHSGVCRGQGFVGYHLQERQGVRVLWGGV